MSKRKRGNIDFDYKDVKEALEVVVQIDPGRKLITKGKLSDFEVIDSNIKGAKNGLAYKMSKTKTFKKGDVLGVYVGDLIFGKKEVKDYTSNDERAEYVISHLGKPDKKGHWDDTWAIDGRDLQRNMFGYMNDASFQNENHPHLNNNCEFLPTLNFDCVNTGTCDPYPDGTTGKPVKRYFTVVATEDIHPGEELFVFYGPGYWPTEEKKEEKEELKDPPNIQRHVDKWKEGVTTVDLTEDVDDEGETTEEEEVYDEETFKQIYAARMRKKAMIQAADPGAPGYYDRIRRQYQG